ncbi:MAG: phosphoribosylformylglycinamidine cyclo-ligase [Propionibacteriaceae bacterium]|jgi:phosphoribosylformylglycinamidine cyclo-ligase|nr:phosphoribosylformylglycinamidine cyclo-ligase [Propionibacteriaceae bacterium]
MTEQTAYAKAGVDIRAGDAAVELMKAHVAQATRPEVIGGLGGFAGLFDLSAIQRFRHPVLATSTDGVGTKVAIAQAMGVYDTIGFDLVGMLVDDLVVVGAEPLFVTDYIACGKVHPERIAQIVAGIARACAEAGAALLGGETAEHPGLLGGDDFDVAGATTGVVEADDILGERRVQIGDQVLCLASSGLHSNGFSLVRQVLLNEAKMSLEAEVAELSMTLGEKLLTPTKVYAMDCLSVIRAIEVHAMSHITGGGLANNLARVMPSTMTAQLDRGSWTPDPIFALVQDRGGISRSDLEETLNMGVGMVMILPQTSVASARSILNQRGVQSWVAGEVFARGAGDPAVSLTGSHQ